MTQKAVTQASIVGCSLDEAGDVRYCKRCCVRVVQHAQLWPQGCEGVVCHLQQQGETSLHDQGWVVSHADSA